MYSPNIIQLELSRLASQGSSLTYYSEGYINACVEHLANLAELDNKGKFVTTTRQLQPDELAFINNERLLCALDYHHWATNYHYIRHAKEMRMIRFHPNHYQQVLNLAQARMEDRGVPIEIQLLKARQGGGTTDTTSKIQHRAQFIRDTSGVIASSDPDKSWKLSEMISRSLALQPWWLKSSTLKEFESGEVFLEDKPRNISITIQHGAQQSGISQGDTVNIAHFSELPYFQDPKSTIQMGFMPAHHPSTRTLVVYESTADGRNNWWHKFWQENKERYALEQSIVQPLFLPWYLSRDIYPTSEWLRAIPIPRGYIPSDYVLNHARSAREYVRSNPLLREVLGSSWEMPIEQIWYYQFEYEKSLRDETLNVFLATMPATDQEAFQSKSKSVFSIQLIQEYEVRVPPPVGVFKLRGTEIPTVIEPSSEELLVVGEDYKQIDLTYESPSIDIAGAIAKCKWSLLPIKFPGYSSVKSHLDTLWVWEYPRKNNEYCVSLDAAQGIGRDRSVITVVRKGTPNRPAGQVASFSTDRLGGLEMWPICLVLLSYYTTYSEHQGREVEPLFSPETASDGASTLMEIRKRGYSNLYLRRTLANRDQDAGTIHQYGWLTTGSSRHLLTTWLLRILRGRFYELNSYWTIDEMRDFVAKDPTPGSRLNGEVRIEHDHGAHDDDLFSNAIGIVTLHDLDIYQGESPTWASLIQRISEMINLPVYSDDVIGSRFKLEEFDLDGAWQQHHSEVLYPLDTQVGSHMLDD